MRVILQIRFFAGEWNVVQELIHTQILEFVCFWLSLQLWDFTPLTLCMSLANHCNHKGKMVRWDWNPKSWSVVSQPPGAPGPFQARNCAYWRLNFQTSQKHMFRVKKSLLVWKMWNNKISWLLWGPCLKVLDLQLWIFYSILILVILRWL